MAKTGGIFGTGRRGGARPGAGRPRGKADKVKRKLLELTKKHGRSATEEMLWDYQLLGEIARANLAAGELDEAAKYAVLASEAAARAAPYMHAKIPTAVNHTHHLDLTKLTDAQLSVYEELTLAAAADPGSDQGREDTTHH